MLKIFFFLFLICIFLGNIVVGKELEKDQTLELYRKIKCLVCEGQSIESSESEFSKLLRIKVKKHLENGKSEEEIKLLLVEEYGKDILFEPPLDLSTSILWFSPLFFLIMGLFIIYYYRKKTL